jgi:hypothetical protein
VSAETALAKVIVIDRQLHADAVTGWLKDASADYQRPSLGSGLRWLARCAEMKARAVLATRALHVLEQVNLSNTYRADALLGAGRDLAIDINAKHEVALWNAQKELAEATELLEIAERVVVLLDRPRPATGGKRP